MKQTPLQRKTPMRRSANIPRGGQRNPLAEPGGMANTAGKFSSLTRGRPRRIDREAVFKPYVAWLHGLPCVACGIGGPHANIQGSHVGNGGMGQKRGGAEDQVPMCGTRAAGTVDGCHLEWGGSYGRFARKSKTWRQVAAWGWRRDCWRAFLAWVRVEIRRQDLDDEEEEKLVVCFNAIGNALYRLAPGDARGAA